MRCRSGDAFCNERLSFYIVIDSDIKNGVDCVYALIGNSAEALDIHATR